MRIRTMFLAVTCLALAFSATAFADVTGFETGDPSWALKTGGAGVATQDCTVAHTGSCSAQLYLPNSGTDAAAGSLVWNGTLATIYSSVWGLTSSSATLFPYLDYYVDSNQNGSIESAPTDSLVILAQSPIFTSGQWAYEVLNGDSLVHVFGNRVGLVGTQFTPGNPGTLNDLRAMSIGGGQTWGDLIVMRARAEAGNWGDSGPTYTAWVDDLSVSSVPEPGTVVLLGTLLLGLAACRKLKKLT